MLYSKKDLGDIGVFKQCYTNKICTPSHIHVNVSTNHCVSESSAGSQIIVRWWRHLVEDYLLGDASSEQEAEFVERLRFGVHEALVRLQVGVTEVLAQGNDGHLGHGSDARKEPGTNGVSGFVVRCTPLLLRPQHLRLVGFDEAFDCGVEMRQLHFRLRVVQSHPPCFVTDVHNRPACREILSIYKMYFLSTGL